MKTFIINLERSKVRRENVTREVEAQGIDYELISAVDGSALSDQQLSDVPMTEEVRANPNYYTKSVIGAALSHIRVYQKIVDEKVGLALVMEDDAVLTGNFARVLDDVQSKIAVNEIIVFHYMSFRPLILSTVEAQSVGNGFGLYYPVDFSSVNSGAGYVITQAAAQSLLSVVSPIQAEADSWAQFYEQGGFGSIRFVYPMPLTVRGEKSTIAADHQSWLRARITNIINDYEISPFFEILRYARLKSIKSRSQVKLIQTQAASRRVGDYS